MRIEINLRTRDRTSQFFKTVRRRAFGKFVRVILRVVIRYHSEFEQAEARSGVANAEDRGVRLSVETACKALQNYKVCTAF